MVPVLGQGSRAKQAIAENSQTRWMQVPACNVPMLQG